MKRLYLNETESRIAIAALQLLERELATKMDVDALAPDPITEFDPLPSAMRERLDRHGAISALTLQLAKAGTHWLDHKEMGFAAEGLERYVRVLATSVTSDQVAWEDFLLDPELRRRQAELAKSSDLLRRLHDR